MTRTELIDNIDRIIGDYEGTLLQQSLRVEDLKTALVESEEKEKQLELENLKQKEDINRLQKELVNLQTECTLLNKIIEDQKSMINKLSLEIDRDKKAAERKNSRPKIDIEPDYKTYFLDKYVKVFKNGVYTQKKIKAAMQIINGNYVLRCGSQVADISRDKMNNCNLINRRKLANIKDGVLKEHLVFGNPYQASDFVLGFTGAGIKDWEDKNGKCITVVERLEANKK